MVVVFAVAIRPQAIFLVVIAVARHTLICMNLFYMAHRGLLEVR